MFQKHNMPSVGVSAEHQAIYDRLHELILTGKANSKEYDALQEKLYCLPRQKQSLYDMISPELRRLAEGKDPNDVTVHAGVDQGGEEEEEDEEEEDEEEEEEEEEDASEAEEDSSLCL
jgi:hypothetical protein